MVYIDAILLIGRSLSDLSDFSPTIAPSVILTSSHWSKAYQEQIKSNSPRTAFDLICSWSACDLL